jgi:hypothetical protein
MFIPFVLTAIKNLKIFGAVLLKVFSENGTYIFIQNAKKFLEYPIVRVFGWDR